MDLFKAKFIILLLSFTLIAGAGVGASLYYIFPDFYPQWYVPILLFFFLLETAVIYAADAGSKKLKQLKLVNMYMLIKGAKMLLSLIFIGIYALSVKVGIKSFVLIFVLFYFLFMIFETYYFAKIEQRIKKENK